MDNFGRRLFQHSIALTDSWENHVQRVRDEYSLTKAESEIAVLLSLGCTPIDISEIRCRSVETIRTQIKTIHRKLNYSRTGMIASSVSRLLRQPQDEVFV